MSITWLVVLAVLFLVVIVAALLRKDDPYQAAATELGLNLTRTVPDLLPNLDGLVNALAVKIDVSANRELALRYEVFYPALGLSLKLERETTITRTLGQLGAADPQVGSKPFDDSFRVHTSRPDALQAMMTPARRHQLIQLIEKYPNVLIADGSISLVGDSLEAPAETIVATTRDLVAAAETLVAGRPPALVPPEPAQLTPTPAASPPALERQDPPPPTRPSESQPASETVELPVDAQPAAAVSDSGLPPEFFEDVFGANRLSFESEGRFDAEIRGTTVTLSGEVRQASPYEGDDDLSSQAGTKATVTVAQIDNDLYGKTNINAVVYLVTTIDPERGDTIKFRGTIEKVDPFMRNVFITDAELLSPA